MIKDSSLPLDFIQTLKLIVLLLYYELKHVQSCTQVVSILVHYFFHNQNDAIFSGKHQQLKFKITPVSVRC